MIKSFLKKVKIQICWTLLNWVLVNLVSCLAMGWGGLQVLFLFCIAALYLCYLTPAAVPSVLWHLCSQTLSMSYNIVFHHELIFLALYHHSTIFFPGDMMSLSLSMTRPLIIINKLGMGSAIYLSVNTLSWPTLAKIGLWLYHFARSFHIQLPQGQGDNAIMKKENKQQ